METAKNQGCQIICCSALLTTTMSVMGDVVKAAEAAGIRDQVKIMIGGAPVTEAFCQQIGADKYTPDGALLRIPPWRCAPGAAKYIPDR